MLIDFHTHNPKPDICCIESLSLNDFPSDSWFTYGLHPWLIQQMSFNQFESHFLKLKESSRFLALGEAGLDRACALDFDKQVDVFSRQLHLAHKHNIKVVIIHCVRALSDILHTLKHSPFKGILVFHDANFNTQEVKTIVDQGHYLSLGNNLFKTRSRAKDSLSSAPLNRIFLETDDTKFAITDVYLHAANLLNINPDKLEQQVLKNFQVLFPQVIST